MTRKFLLFLAFIGASSSVCVSTGYADEWEPDNSAGIACAPPIPVKSIYIRNCVDNCVNQDGSHYKAGFCEGIFNSLALKNSCAGTWKEASVCATDEDPPDKHKQPNSLTDPQPPAATSPKGPKKSATASPKESTGDPNLDRQRCQQLAQQAISCCNNPSSCTNLDTGASLGIQNNANAGINQNCQAMNQAGSAAGDNNNQAGAACYRAYSSCVVACDTANMSSTSSSCRQLSSRVSALGSSGLNSYNAAGVGNNCNSAASGMNPQSLGGANDPNSQLNQQSATNAQDPYGCQQNPGSAVCQNCAINPNSPTCKALATGQQDAQGKASFTTASKDTGGDPNSFNVADSIDDPNTHILPAKPGQQPEGHTIPNGGGGGIPGSQDNRPGQGDQSRRGGGGYSPGNSVADIDQGLRSGGYSGAGGPPGESENPGGGFGGYGKGAAGGRVPAGAGMDLKKYLPGQRLDPMNRMGGNSMVSAEINGKSCDMFKKISARIQEKCKLGVLLGCH